MLRWAQRILFIAGAAMLAWSALLLIEATLAQREARRALERASAVITPPAPAKDHAPAAPAPPARAPLVRGAPIAELSIPRVHLSTVVLHGSDDQTLRRGPGHLEGGPLPGEPGNVAIAGHRDSFFRPLRNVRLGDDIFVQTSRGRFQYRVTSLRVVKPQDVSVLNATDEPVLTLITCYPFWVLGPAPDRYIVRAIGVDLSAAAVEQTVVTQRRPEEPPGRRGPEDTLLRRAPEDTLMRRGPSWSADSGSPPPGPAAARPPALDDKGQVQQAIERFRHTYNARLARRNDATAPPLHLQPCDVTTFGDQGEATCEALPLPPAGAAARVWAFTLERAGGDWAIRSIATR